MANIPAESPVGAAWVASDGTVDIWNAGADAGSRLVLTNDEAAARAAAVGGVVVSVLHPLTLIRPTANGETLEELLDLFCADEPKGRPWNARRLAGLWDTVRDTVSLWSEELRTLVLELLHASPSPWREIGMALTDLSTFHLTGSVERTAERCLLGRPLNPEKPPKRMPPDPDSYQTLDPDDVASYLAAGGPCSQRIDGYEERPGQLQMIRAVTQALNDGRHLLVEAGTGVGKSVAYLLPAIRWALLNRDPVVVSTNTKNLQSQLFHKDIPVLRHVLGDRFSAALIKGRRNYVCLRRIRQLLENREGDLREDEFPTLARVLVWAMQTGTGDLDDIDRLLPHDGEASLRYRLVSSSEECAGRSCRFYRHCLMQRARILSVGADIVVANHSLVFSEEDGSEVALPLHSHVVFDEAHNLEEAATLQFTRTVGMSSFSYPLRKLWRGTSRRVGGLLEDVRKLLHSRPANISEEAAEEAFERNSAAIVAVETLRKSAHAYLAELATILPRQELPRRYRAANLTAPHWVAIEPQRRQMVADLKRLLGELEALATILRGNTDEDPPPNLAELLRDLNAAAGMLTEVDDTVAYVTGAMDEDYVYWLSLVRRGPGERQEVLGVLSAAPVDVSRLLADTLYAKRRSVILTSATLSVDGSFGFWGGRVGLNLDERDRLMQCRADSPFDYDRQCRVRVPMFLPDPGLPGSGLDYAQKLASFLLDLAERTRGRMLVLFTSYDAMRQCAEVMRPRMARLGYTLLVQGMGISRDRLTRTFRNDVHSVLLGTDSFWEGVDVMGEALSCVVITRLPFDSPGDPLIEARAERVAQLGGSSFRQYALPNAIIKFRQGFGRLIRHRDDTGWVVITDRRIREKPYGMNFRRNLPCGLKFPQTPSELLDEAETFFSERDKSQ